MTAALGLLLVVGSASIITGRIFLEDQQEIIEQTKIYQEKHLETQQHLYSDDLGLLLYYLKFSFIKPLSPLAGVAIGQSDLQSNVQHVKMLNLEGQKYDTDLVNPVRLQVGNLDLAFTIVFLFPLVIIGLMFNLRSQEVEAGTWNIVRVQGTSPLMYLMKKCFLRLALVVLCLCILFGFAILILNIPIDGHFWSIGALSLTYILFWFSLCFALVLLEWPSGSNAITMLSLWLLLTILIPTVFNNYVNSKYPIDDAFSMAIKQRDAYHQKWDTDKRATMDKFYAHYPQFSHYELQEEGFSWLWYYAMQQMGDDESSEERGALYDKVESRERLSKKMAQFIPPLQLQLAMNDIANTSLSDHVDFLHATTAWHEDIRLRLYPKIFDGKTADDVDWGEFKPVYFKVDSKAEFLEYV